MNPSARNDPPGAALDAALRELISTATVAVKSFAADPGGRAHVIRTRVKRLQALSHLVPRGGDWRRRLLPPCRELKDLFAGTRDATILRALAEARSSGQALVPPIVPLPDLARAGELAAQAVAALESYREWPDAEWDEMVERLLKSYRAEGRARHAAAREDAPDSAFHAWRRRAKRLLYQCEFCGAWARLHRWVRDLERLGEVLGEVQDARMAEDWLAPHVQPAEVEALRRHRMKLRRKALRRAEKLPTLTARQFRRMLAHEPV